MPIVYAGVDGTGENDNDSYARTFADSFVNRYYQTWPYNDRRFYHRGPRLAGTETAQYARKAFDYIQWATDTMGCQAIFLAGYSRGGAAVIEVAKWLKEVGKEVECLILFDAVDRTNTVGENRIPFTVPNLGATIIQQATSKYTPIPNTVKHVIHAMRMPETLSRESFGNCGTRYEAYDPTRHHTKQFYATHGGLGGTPWPAPNGASKNNFINEGFPDNRTYVPYRQDEIGSQEVWNWVNPKVQQILKACQRRLQAPARSLPMTHRFAARPI